MYGNLSILAQSIRLMFVHSFIRIYLAWSVEHTLFWRCDDSQTLLPSLTRCLSLYLSLLSLQFSHLWMDSSCILYMFNIIGKYIIYILLYIYLLCSLNSAIFIDVRQGLFGGRMRFRRDFDRSLWVLQAQIQDRVWANSVKACLERWSRLMTRQQSKMCLTVNSAYTDWRLYRMCIPDSIIHSYTVWYIDTNLFVVFFCPPSSIAVTENKTATK